MILTQYGIKTLKADFTHLLLKVTWATLNVDTGFIQL